MKNKNQILLENYINYIIQIRLVLSNKKLSKKQKLKEIKKIDFENAVKDKQVLECSL